MLTVQIRTAFLKTLPSIETTILNFLPHYSLCYTLSCTHFNERNDDIPNL